MDLNKSNSKSKSKEDKSASSPKSSPTINKVQSDLGKVKSLPKSSLSINKVKSSPKSSPSINKLQSDLGKTKSSPSPSNLLGPKKSSPSSAGILGAKKSPLSPTSILGAKKSLLLKAKSVPIAGSKKSPISSGSPLLKSAPFKGTKLVSPPLIRPTKTSSVRSPTASPPIRPLIFGAPPKPSLIPRPIAPSLVGVKKSVVPKSPSFQKSLGFFKKAEIKASTTKSPILLTKSPTPKLPISSRMQKSPSFQKSLGFFKKAEIKASTTKSSIVPIKSTTPKLPISPKMQKSLALFQKKIDSSSIMKKPTPFVFGKPIVKLSDLPSPTFFKPLSQKSIFAKKSTLLRSKIPKAIVPSKKSPIKSSQSTGPLISTGLTTKKPSILSPPKLTSPTKSASPKSAPPLSPPRPLAPKKIPDYAKTPAGPPEKSVKAAGLFRKALFGVEKQPPPSPPPPLPPRDSQPSGWSSTDSDTSSGFRYPSGTTGSPSYVPTTTTDYSSSGGRIPSDIFGSAFAAATGPDFRASTPSPAGTDWERSKSTTDLKEERRSQSKLGEVKSKPLSKSIAKLPTVKSTKSPLLSKSSTSPKKSATLVKSSLSPVKSDTLSKSSTSPTKSAPSSREGKSRFAIFATKSSPGSREGKSKSTILTKSTRSLKEGKSKSIFPSKSSPGESASLFPKKSVTKLIKSAESIFPAKSLTDIRKSQSTGSLRPRRARIIDKCPKHKQDFSKKWKEFEKLARS